MSLEKSYYINTVNLEDKLRSLPQESGVYIFKNSDSQTIYIGKAKNLQNRVRTYFRKSSLHDLRVAPFVRKIVDLEWIITANESAALILENNLIKLHKPRYNIHFKDDASYPYIKVTIKEKYPRLFLTRQLEKDGSRYYGPYSSVFDARLALQVIHKYFPIRKSKMDLDSGKIFRPCINFQLKRCIAPCRGVVDVTDYLKIVKQIESLLSGNYQGLISELKKGMLDKSIEQDYESAAQIRDQIKSVKATLQKKPPLKGVSKQDCDLISVAYEEGFVGAQILFVRRGIIVGSDFDLLKSEQAHSEEEVLRYLFAKVYIGQDRNPPCDIYVPQITPETKMLEAYYKKEHKFDMQIKVATPIEKKLFYDSCVQNCLANLKLHINALNTQESILSSVQQKLSLKNLPRKVECFDISNLSGTNSVASMIVFINNQPSKKHYKKFKIKTVEGVDDFASMAEVIKRRYERGLKNDWEFPDLVIIDGGMGQLNAALMAIDSSESIDSEIKFDIIALAKGRSQKVRHKFEKYNSSKNYDLPNFDYVIKPGISQPIKINDDSIVLHFLQRVRDEAHRFAITYHRNLRSKEMLKSSLDFLPGIGGKKKNLLLSNFTDINNIRQASLSELSAIKGISIEDAKLVLAHLNAGS